MPSPLLPPIPGLSSFLVQLKTNHGQQGLESSTERLISLFKRRQICGSRACAIATTKLLLQVVAEFRGRDVARLMTRIRHVGQRLETAQPKEMTIGNIVRRVLGLVREICEEESNEESPYMSEDATSPPRRSLQRPGLTSSISTYSPLKGAAIQPSGKASQVKIEDETETGFQNALSLQRPKLFSSSTSFATGPAMGSLFGIFSSPNATSPTPGSPSHNSGLSSPAVLDLSELTLVDKPNHRDIKADIIAGIEEIADEIDQCSDQIAGYALDHIHADEIVLVHGMSRTIRKFLLTAARKRKFTTVLVESEVDGPSILHAPKSSGMSEPTEDDTAASDPLATLNHKNLHIVIIPHSAVFAIMSRINKVLLATHAVLANGALVASVGAYNIAQAAKVHQVPVVVLSGVYKLSPMYPFNTDELVEWGGTVTVSKGLREGVYVSNPVKEYVPDHLVELYVTNLGGHAPTYLYRIVQDHYHIEDVNLYDEL